jgi:hypothetical protein
MKKCRQTFRNNTDKPLFINLELSTARYRLKPNEELVLFYDPTDVQDNEGSALRIEFITDADRLQLVLWTGESQMFLPDGRPAPEDFDTAPPPPPS